MKGKLTAARSLANVPALVLIAALVSVAMASAAFAGSYGMTPGDLREVGGEPTWQWRPQAERGVQLGMESHPESFTSTDIRFRPRTDWTNRTLDARVYGQEAYAAGYHGTSGLGRDPYSGFMAGRFQSSLTGSQSSIRNAARTSLGSVMGQSVLAPVSSYGSSYQYTTPYESMAGMYGSTYSGIGGAPSLYGASGSARP